MRDARARRLKKKRVLGARHSFLFLTKRMCNWCTVSDTHHIIYLLSDRSAIAKVFVVITPFYTKDFFLVLEALMKHDYIYFYINLNIAFVKVISLGHK